MSFIGKKFTMLISEVAYHLIDYNTWHKKDDRNTTSQKIQHTPFLYKVKWSDNAIQSNKEKQKKAAHHTPDIRFAFLYPITVKNLKMYKQTKQELNPLLLTEAFFLFFFFSFKFPNLHFTSTNQTLELTPKISTLYFQEKKIEIHQNPKEIQTHPKLKKHPDS